MERPRILTNEPQPLLEACGHMVWYWCHSSESDQNKDYLKAAGDYPNRDADMHVSEIHAFYQKLGMTGKNPGKPSPAADVLGALKKSPVIWFSTFGGPGHMMVIEAYDEPSQQFQIIDPWG